MHLDEAQRLLLINQYRILEALDPEQLHSYRRARVILEGGFAAHYTDLPVFESLLSLSQEECIEVQKILEMFEAIQEALARSEDEHLKTTSGLTFDGFAGNDERVQMLYTEFLKREGGWENVGHPVKAYHPHPSLPRYRRLLAVWNTFDAPAHLQDEQLQELAKVAWS